MYEQRIKHLEEAHRALDKQIDTLEKTGLFEDLKLEEMKKQRLHLKDNIAILKQNIAKQYWRTFGPNTITRHTSVRLRTSLKPEGDPLGPRTIKICACMYYALKSIPKCLNLASTQFLNSSISYAVNGFSSVLNLIPSMSGQEAP